MPRLHQGQRSGRLSPPPGPPETPAPLSAWRVEWNQPATTLTGTLATPTATAPAGAAADIRWIPDGGMPEPGRWGWTDASWMAFRTAMPLVHVFARSEWEPSSRELPPPCWLPRRWYWFTDEGLASLFRILSYIIWPILISAWTGLLKNR